MAYFNLDFKMMMMMMMRCQIFGGKNVQNSISAGMGSLQRSSAGGAYNAPLTPWLHIRSPTFKVRGGEGEKEGQKRVWP